MADSIQDHAYIEVVLDSGRNVLLLATDRLETAGPPRPTDVSFASQLKFSELIETIAEIGTAVKAGIDRIAPDEAIVEVSLAVNAKTGRVAALFTDAGVESAFKVLLKWSAR